MQRRYLDAARAFNIGLAYINRCPCLELAHVIKPNTATYLPLCICALHAVSCHATATGLQGAQQVGGKRDKTADSQTRTT